MAAVTVTYGARGDLALRVLSAALQEGVGRVIVVANGSSADTLNDLRRATSDDQRVVLVELQRNLGSAAGFGAGITAALAYPDADAVWLLDDDNVPRVGALRELLALRSSMGARDGDTALLSFRTGLGYMRGSLARGTGAYPGPSSFLDFDLLTFLRRRTVSPVNASSRPPATSEIPYAPYGGLFLTRSLLARIGVPDRDFVVYTDDTEYTARIPVVGGTILLVRDSLVDDVADSGLAAEGGIKRLPKWVWFGISEDWRAYYALRNKVALDLRRTRSRTRFAINGSVLICWLLLLGLASGRIGRLRVMGRAILDGLRGRLGETYRLPSP